MSVSEDEYLQSVNVLIEERLRFSNSDDVIPENLLATIARHLCVSKHAKRARPLLCLYYHWMLSTDMAKDFQRIAVAAEFIHAASLLHDDIIDNAEIRRGKFSANHVFGNQAAVLAGDFLLTEAFDLLSGFERELSNRAILVIREMTKASILEVEARGKLHLQANHWKAIASGKTGALFSWCGYAAGFLCQNIEAALQFWTAGHHIGMIFQLADDLKDFHGDQNLKDVCRDIRNLEPSMPIILAINKDNIVAKHFRDAFLSGDISEARALSLRDAIIESGALKETLELFEKELDKLFAVLSPFAGSLGKNRIDNFIAELGPHALIALE